MNLKINDPEFELDSLRNRGKKTPHVSWEWICDTEKTAIPGFQVSIYWYHRWIPLISINAWRWGITMGRINVLD